MSQGGALNNTGSSPAAPGNFPITPFVVGPVGQAGYQTIQSAINAAVLAGGVSRSIYVQPGTYTENLDFSACTIFTVGLTLCGAVALGDEGQCEIIGQHNPPISGSLVFRNFKLTGSPNIINSNAVGSARLVFIDMLLNVVNGYTVNCPNWGPSGIFEFFDINNAGTNDGGVNNTGGASLFIFEAGLGNGTVNPMILSGLSIFDGANIGSPISAVTGGNIISTNVNYSNTVSFLNNSTGSFTHDKFATGSTPCITQSSSGIITLAQSVLNTSNNPAISGTGAGAFTLAGVTYLNNSVISGSLTIISSIADIFGEIRAGKDSGGQANFTSITNTNSQTIAGGTGTVKMSSSNNANNAAWIKIYVGTTPFWIPAWTTNAP